MESRSVGGGFSAGSGARLFLAPVRSPCCRQTSVFATLELSQLFVLLPGSMGLCASPNAVYQVLLKLPKSDAFPLFLIGSLKLGTELCSSSKAEPCSLMLCLIQRLQTVAFRSTWLVVYHLAQTEFNKLGIKFYVLHRYLHLRTERSHIKICISSFFGKIGSAGNIDWALLLSWWLSARAEKLLTFLTQCVLWVTKSPRCPILSCELSALLFWAYGLIE